MKCLMIIISLILLVSPAIADPAGKTVATDTENAWWSSSDTGWIGGIGGSVVGIIGGLIGCLVGFGKARRFVLLLMIGLIAFGVICLVVGIVALILSQPYAVYYPLILFGVIDPAVLGGNYRSVRRRYEEAELRKMKAMDVSES